MASGDDSTGRTLKVLRALGDNSQAEFGEALGVTQATYSRYESGKVRLSPERAAEALSRLAFAPRDVAQDAVAIGEHSAEEILGINTQVKEAIENTILAWQRDQLTRSEAVSQIAPLLQLQKVLLAALRARLRADA